MKILFFIAFTLFITNYCQAHVAKSSASSDSIYTFVQQNPEFAGGVAELMKFIMKNVQAPSGKNDDEFCGEMLIKLVIDTDGSVIDPEIKRSCGKQWDNELFRVIKLLPKFKPGYQNGKAVKVYFNLPIFDLDR